ncbi:fructosamine kinase family protein [Kaustia mangrovi]|uniref:Fructosamine kinase family protein n=1 Tax=Kaustia mangrovi TaxID=2593653 RepID=A0A7S8C2Y8_9HYPH|nr:fructosamine kinase family protein [Kaustia mangrovi]QPC42414.1 fructosamine kinase family protein [Kaustia mangrovi]
MPLPPASETAVDRALAGRIETALATRALAARPLAGGSTVAVLAVDLADGTTVVAKWGDGMQELEAWMLAELARRSDLPLPAVRHVEPGLLLLDHVPHEAGLPGPDVWRHAADLLAALHAIPQPRFGLGRDTAIGRLAQPNPQGESWVAFFRDHRLLHMAREGHREGTVGADLLRRLEALAGRLEQWLDEPAHPALLHGDVWPGNMLHRAGRLAALIDPAISCGHPELEMAYPTMFAGYDPAFLARYGEHRPIDPGFFEIRREIYLIYPRLVHVRYWDTAYAGPILATLDRLGL